jgi:hypothetical protein
MVLGIPSQDWWAPFTLSLWWGYHVTEGVCGRVKTFYHESKNNEEVEETGIPQPPREHPQWPNELGSTRPYFLKVLPPSSSTTPGTKFLTYEPLHTFSIQTVAHFVLSLASLVIFLLLLLWQYLWLNPGLGRHCTTWATPIDIFVLVILCSGSVDHCAPVCAFPCSWDDGHAPPCPVIGWHGVLWTFFLGWLWTVSHLVSAFQEARITGLSHHACQA